MSTNYVTQEDLAEILKQIRGTFCAIAAMRLKPGAKINGVLFDGTHDITVPNSLQDDMYLTAGQRIGIEYESVSDGDPVPGWIIQNDGIYFSPDGTLESAVPIATADKNQDGTFTVEVTSGQATATPAAVESNSGSNEPQTLNTQNVMANVATTDRTIGFKV
ncbi:MAG: hypothetical protein IJS96_03360 [Schwartzia sp.]|nr:hypothetical protein [Schwartzia sp. (in: firmicutes)]